MPKKSKVLLTGISGFIGAHVLEHLLTNTDLDVIGIASWKHKGTPERVEEVLDGPMAKILGWRERVTIITHDLVSPIPQRTMERIGQCDYILNLAAESHVDRSIEEPVPFILNNVNLVLNVLEFARIYRPKVFIQISTDEVYGVAPEGVNHKEWSPIVPSNPYSASKACQEAIAISYWRTYGVPLIITNTMNNFGEMQDTEKYVAQLIRKVSREKIVSVHGTKDKIGSRYYLHARNHADALVFLMGTKPVVYEEGKDILPDRYNVVGDVELDNLEMASMVAHLQGKPLKYEFIDHHATRPGHDRRYALDGSKLKALGWKPPIEFAASLKKCIDWTLENKIWL